MAGIGPVIMAMPMPMFRSVTLELYDNLYQQPSIIELF